MQIEIQPDVRDARILAAKQVEEQLRSSSYRGLRHVSCTVQHGKLTLQGQVVNYHLKQLAQSLARRLGVMVDNQIHVASKE